MLAGIVTVPSSAASHNAAALPTVQFTGRYLVAFKKLKSTSF